MRVFLGKVGLFFCAAMLCLSALGRVVPYYWGEPQLVAKMTELERLRRGIDTLFIGSSRVYRSVDPEVFDRCASPPTASFNLGIAAMGGLECTSFCRDFFGSALPPRLRYALLELQNVPPIDDANLNTVRAKYYLDLADCLFAVEYFSSASFLSPAERRGVIRNYSLAYRDNVFKVGMVGPILGFRLAPPRPDARVLGPAADGFFSLDADLGHDSERWRQLRRHPVALEERLRDAREIYQKRPVAEPNRFLLERYRALIAQAQRRGVRLILVLFPLQSRWTDLVPVFDAIPRGHRIDMGDPFENPEFYNLDYCYDANHLNEKGVRLLTERLAEKFNGLRGEGDARPGNPDLKEDGRRGSF